MEIIYKTGQANKASSFRNKIPFSIKEHIESVEKNSGKKITNDQFITGSYQQCILFLMWLNILWIALKEFKNPFKAVRQFKALKQLRNQYRNGMMDGDWISLPGVPGTGESINLQDPNAEGTRFYRVEVR